MGATGGEIYRNTAYKKRRFLKNKEVCFYTERESVKNTRATEAIENRREGEGGSMVGGWRPEKGKGGGIKE